MNIAKADVKILLLADPEIITIPVQDNGEPLIDLKNQNVIAYGPSPEIPNNTDYTKMRKTVYEKIVAAQKNLPNNWKFCIYEAYRSLNLQQKLFEDRYALLQKLNPSWEHEKIFTECTRLVSPVINLDGSRNVPPHSTGGAIDIYVVDTNGEVVEMGLKLADWMHDIDGSISVTNSSKISTDAQRNRDIMSKVLAEQGLINYQNEYWHWSYGDRYWAHYSKQNFAFYGSVKDH